MERDAVFEVTKGTSPAAADLAVASKLLLLQPGALRSMLGLVASDGALDTKVEPARGCRQVVLARDRGELDAVLLGKVDQVLVLARLACKSVSVPGGDGSDAALLSTGKHLLKVGPALAPIGAEVVVNEDALHLPAQPFA